MELRSLKVAFHHPSGLTEDLSTGISLLVLGFFPSAVAIVLIVISGFFWSSIMFTSFSNSFEISGMVAKLSWVSVISGVLCSGSVSVAGVLRNCSRLKGCIGRSVGLSPMMLWLRCSGNSSSDEGDRESSYSPKVTKVPFRVIVSVRWSSRFVEEARSHQLDFCYDFGGVMPIPQQSLESFVNAELKEV